jgi:hypothetical protein
MAGTLMLLNVLIALLNILIVNRSPGKEIFRECQRNLVVLNNGRQVTGC